MKTINLKPSVLVVIFLSVFTLQPLAIPVAQASYEHVPEAGIAINGEMVSGIKPIKIQGEYYLPFTYLSKLLKYNDIKFNNTTKTYQITDGSTMVRITFGGTKARRGDEYINITAPRWINNTTYISLDAASSLFNSNITFKPENGSIQVQQPAHYYEVQPGDTLWKISQAHHTTVSILRATNNLKSDIIRPGQRLNLPSRSQAKEVEPKREHQPVKHNPTPNPSVFNAIIDEGKKYIGASYKFGATLSEAPRFFDCSSFTQYIFGNNGIKLPRTSREQAALGTTVSSLKPGDLVFFTDSTSYSDGRVGHLGIYIGNGNMLHASSSKGVHIAENFMDIKYWKDNYLFAKRIQ